MKTESTTISEYLQQIPPRWLPMLTDLRDQLRTYVDKGFVESLRWGMITYEVPLEISGPTYNKEPLMFAALAAQKNYCSLYLMAIYASPEKMAYLEKAYYSKGLKPNMGKSCIRFKNLEDIPLPEILQLLKDISVEDFLAMTRA